MSIVYCEKHDRRWDSDMLEECPLCENEHPSSSDALDELAIADKFAAEWLAGADSEEEDVNNLARAYLAIRASLPALQPVSEAGKPETPGSWEERCAALYQVIGALADAAGVFETSGSVADALDVACGRGDLEKLLPWPKDDDPVLTIRAAPPTTNNAEAQGATSRDLPETAPKLELPAASAPSAINDTQRIQVDPEVMEWAEEVNEGVSTTGEMIMAAEILRLNAALSESVKPDTAKECEARYPAQGGNPMPAPTVKWCKPCQRLLPEGAVCARLAPSPSGVEEGK